MSAAIGQVHRVALRLGRGVFNGLRVMVGRMVSGVVVVREGKESHGQGRQVKWALREYVEVEIMSIERKI